MSTKTTNLGLDKPAMSDTPGVTIPQLANNFDVIDGQLAQIATNVKNYGAKGDGTTDDTTAFNNAISSMNQGDVLYVPNGQYKITSTINISKSIKICGSKGTGANATTTGGSVILYNGTDKAFYITKQNVSIEHLYVLNQGASTVNGIVVAGTSGASISEFKFKEVNVNGFNHGFDVTYAFLVRFTYCRSANAVIGYNVANCDTTVQFEKCWALICSDTGYYINGLTYSNLINCAADQCNHPYHFESCNGVSLLNCGMEVSTGIPIVANNSTMSFIGCVSYKNNSSLESNTSFASFTNSFISFLNCYEYTLYSLSNNISVLLTNTIINMQGSNVRMAVSKDSTSKVYGTYNKDGGVANDTTGDLSTLSTNASTMGISSSDVAGYLNGIMNQITTRYSSGISAITYNRPNYLTSTATGNPVSGEHTVVIPYYQGTERFYMAISATNKIFIGYSSDSGTTINWTPVQRIVSGVTGSRPSSPVAGQRYFDTTLNKPVWYNGTAWVDATGTTV